MARRGRDPILVTGGPDALLPWKAGFDGKFLVEESGAFHAWRTPDGLAPHHSVAAGLLGVSSWVLDGIVNPDGALEVTAMVPGLDMAAMKSRASRQAGELGMRFVVSQPGPDAERRS